MKSPSSIRFDWYAETIFYILEINGIVKFGITSNWMRRLKAYHKETGTLRLRVIKQELLDKRWKAELIEQIVKWRLRPWALPGRHEWMKAPIQLVINCYIETRKTVMPIISDYEYIHKKGNDRWKHYRQLTKTLFDKKLPQSLASKRISRI